MQEKRAIAMPGTVCDRGPIHVRVTACRPLGPALAVLIPWDGCLLGVLLRRTLDRDRRVGLESRVEKLGHRLADLLAQSRPVLTEVLDVPLIKNEPRPEGDARACPRSEV